MSTSLIKHEPLASAVRCDETHLHVTLLDGRELSVPLAWFPRLRHASAAARDRCALIGHGSGIHWEDLDEDISVRALFV